MTASIFEKVLRRILQAEGLTFQPYVVTSTERLSPTAMDVRMDRTAHLVLDYAARVREDLFVSWDGAETVWQRRITNCSGQTVPLVELGVRLEGIGFGCDSREDYFYHAENPRIYQRMAIPVRLKRTPEWVKDSGFDTLAGNRWTDPGVVCERVGASPYQPFPSVLLSNYRTRAGLVHGTLSQRVFYHNHLFTHNDRGVAWDILSSFKAIAHLEFAPGAILEDCWYLGRTEYADEIERVFESYTRVLRKHLPPMRAAKGANRHAVLWGSWNDGVMRDFDQERLLKMADFIVRELPTVRWLQVDDGYSLLSNQIGGLHGLGMPYEGDGGVDPHRFPRGLKAFTDGVKERGLRAGIWIGGYVPLKSRLAQEQPDWFIDYSYRIRDPVVPDVSKPEVREYMMRALDFLITRSGFEAVKLDFWSYCFEDSHPLLGRREASGSQWRSWWLGEIRKRLPEFGYLQGGCDIAMGNPFLGEWMDNYRYGIDIGSGRWENAATNFLWGTACFATHTGDLLVPNSDAIGLLPGLSDNEAQFVINFCLVSRSLVEVAGWLYQHPNHPRLAWVKKALCCPNNGQDVFFADYDYRDEKSSGPPIWFLRTPHFSLLEDRDRLPLRTVAIFNLADEPQTFSLTPAKLRLPAGRYMATDVWTLTTEAMGAFTLPARSSRLFAINPQADLQQILDANIEIEEVQAAGDALAVRFAHRGSLELVVSREPRCVGAQVTQGKGNWVIRHELSEETRSLSLQ